MESMNIRNRKYYRHDEIDVSVDGHLEEKVVGNKTETQLSQ